MEPLVKVEVKSTATSEALRKLADQVSNRRQVNARLAVQMFSWVMRNFDAEGALNHAWASLSPDYEKRKVKKYGATHILIASGLMRASYTTGYDNDSATVGTENRYAPFHQAGAPERNLPARPMLPTPEIALRDATDIYDQYLRLSARNAGLA